MLDWLNVPFIGDFPIGDLKRLPVRRLDAEAAFGRTAPAGEDFGNLVLASLPCQGKRTLRKGGIGAAFDGVHRMTSLESPTFNWMKRPSPLPLTFACLPTSERLNAAS